MQHIFESPSQIVDNIRKFYTTEILKQIYKIVGSLDFVGNPTMLVTSFFSGVRDLVVAPSVAFMKSPTDPSRVGLGVAQGTLSLVSHSVSGFFGVLAKVSAAAGQGVASLSLDPDFRDWHRDKVVVETTNLNREWKRRGVQSVGRMVTRPVVDIVLGVAGGISGIVVSPAKGYRSNGNVGLAKGIAVGCIGVFTRPTVGVLDAFTHFTASIHDIAKSVNVLDRRLQPVLKLRLPYTFGVMSIMAPFDAAAARAAHLLKIFPLPESRRISARAVPETMIHAEVLPSTDTETFAIVTSARVLLVRVKNLLSGSSTTSLCWEVAFSEEAGISSRVDDHGHNGVALTILKRGHGIEGIGESKEGGTSFESSPIGRSTSSSRSMGLTTPDERISAVSAAEAAEEYNHGTGRSEEGHLLEWFTILAEYQYRRQLTRLHNAISCMRGDFDSVVRDRSLSIGRPLSSEGYTSFGMFFFERKNSVDSEGSNAGYVDRFQNLPWVSRASFEEAHDKTPDEQKLYLSVLRRESVFATDLEASRRAGGPEWLIMARARAAFVDNETAMVSSSSGPSRLLASISQLSRSSSWTGQDPLPTIQDDGENDASDASMAFGPSSKYARLIKSENVDDSTGETSPHDGNRLGDLDLTSASPRIPVVSSPQLDMYGYDPRSKKTHFRPSGLRKSRSNSELSDHSFQSFRTAATSGRIAPSNWRDSTSQSHSTFDDGTLGATTDRFSDSFYTTHESYSRASNETESPQATQGERPGAQAPATALDDHPLQQLRPTNDRMDRMQALLERLLIFSSEQALLGQAQHRAAATFDGAAALRQEISELRTLVQQQSSLISGASALDVAALRDDVASLRAQLSLPPPNAVRPLPDNVSGEAYRHIESSTDSTDKWTIEQLD